MVATVTGHGLKDPEIAIDNAKAQSLVVDANMESVLTAIEL